MPKTLDQFAIAAALQEIAILLELKGGTDRFKARAYQTGARLMAGLSEDLHAVIEQDTLTSRRGIGDALASQIKQLYYTGSSSVLDRLRQEFPAGVIELSGVPGLSISKIKALHEALGITTIAELQAAAEAGKVRAVKGFGARTETKLLESIQGHGGRKHERLHIHHAQRIAMQVVNYLQAANGVVKVELAGSLRRWEETVGTIQLVASAKTPKVILDHFSRFPLVVAIEECNEVQCTVVLAEGARVELTVVKVKDFSWTVWRQTGSETHVAKLQQVIARKNSEIDLNTPSAFADGASPATVEAPERQFYESFGMQYVPPELREDSGEVEAALKGKLPEDLITTVDIQGMVHCHTTYSDGKHSVEEMALAAEAMGMKYLTITDHSPTAFYAGGVTIDRLMRQWDEIDEVQEKVKIKLLKGTESDIVASGALDYPDKILEKFDVIVASIHSRYKMDSEKMTRRLVTAMSQPVFKIWGHALGRLIQRRPPFDCDIEKVLDVIAESKAAIEINGDPFRLDMEPRFIREARKRKLKFVISVDAHSTGALNNVKYGVGMARRGWVRKSEVLNVLGVKAFAKAVRPTQ
ncbi:MAG TPA: PHP domain-containing protein [Pyrinomonadaceae bacterium]